MFTEDNAVVFNVNEFIYYVGALMAACINLFFVKFLF